MRVGDNTYLWKDKWTGDVMLKDLFPVLYKIKKRKNVMVNHRLLGRRDGQDFEMEWDWKRTLRRGMEVNELDTLMSQLNVRSSSLDKDKWWWKYDKYGIFSVNSLRKQLVDREDVTMRSNFFWCSWIPLRVNCFVWRLMLNRIPLIDNLWCVQGLFGLVLSNVGAVFVGFDAFAPGGGALILFWYGWSLCFLCGALMMRLW
ncbi:hypothetical protein LXL04_009768 [Taraxacum kok-saghyz]